MVYSDRAREQNLPSIEVHGPQSDEFAPAIQHLFKGELPEGWQWVKSSSNSIIAKRVIPPNYYFKEFLSRSRVESLKSLFRGNRCKRARLQGEVLRRNGFNSPVCCCWGRMENRHFMITEGIDTIGMGEFIYDRWRPPLEKKMIRDKRLIIDNLGSTIGRLHKTGVFHGDLRLNNILLYHRDKEVAFYFIDNERNRIYKKIPKYLIEKNLVQVNLVLPRYVTRQDRLRFYKSYNNVYGRFSGKEQNRLMQRVQIRTEQRLKKIALRTHGL
jgi:tRNA A-37 threonylcarbamoyl transferase component Bud32